MHYIWYRFMTIFCTLCALVLKCELEYLKATRLRSLTRYSYGSIRYIATATQCFVWNFDIWNAAGKDSKDYLWSGLHISSTSEQTPIGVFSEVDKILDSFSFYFSVFIANIIRISLSSSNNTFILFLLVVKTSDILKDNRQVTAVSCRGCYVTLQLRLWRHVASLPSICLENIWTEFTSRLQVTYPDNGTSWFTLIKNFDNIITTT